ncbi:ABC-type branched-subunit amino acid transport system substrate-binding protein [Novosphingobium capsulatum]|uniref:ABC-type branched-subunit amino acid transport system substrate-binding protein n=2 Tax=Novosphingobium TaxID=165696 RepID=A0ABU1MHJ0_9SPHN|nr:ABC-type branched-subunit amino acid transport system substrate-binding protein [Novosphingobium sp. BK256]MBB3374797.1 ABC-type branched-subunit amino acid transport system substrate-binding protein [Novosphingobium sp. BK280]MBB3379514.1 ABC-type branched-subunit amino acid transport system substrate-binding protein [Novosphingobium sp. BK258]MBB3421209.1 ABC-type branched-subunit amino acid transport system substrate-binding protein [Novosphingobium sp. BK267]MBB3449218.1 ABC-type branche
MMMGKSGNNGIADGSRAPSGLSRRRMGQWLALSLPAALLAGCSVIPKPGTPGTPPPPRETAPQENVLPSDAGRHRVALLVPLTGPNAAVGQAIANATTMALLDTNAQSLRITTYDTGAGAAAAASKAVLDGNRLILGPLTSEDVSAVAGVARPAKVPMITYSNDSAVADRDVFVLGQVPGQSIARVIGYAHSQGIRTVGAIVPSGTYGQRVSIALTDAARMQGIRLTAIETYDRSNTSAASAVRRVKARGPIDALLIGDGARIAVQAAPFAKGTRLLGTELWKGDPTLARTPAMKGAWFAAISDDRLPRFEQSYRQRFGAAPARIATLGYDSVLLTLNIARSWKPGTLFPTAKLYATDGFIGTDGVFRFNANGVAERALEVREVSGGTVVTVSRAPEKFTN